MSESDSEDGGSKAAPKRAPGRKARPPVTIDLAAEAAPAESPASVAESSPPLGEATPASAAPVEAANTRVGRNRIPDSRASPSFGIRATASATPGGGAVRSRPFRRASNGRRPTGRAPGG